MKGLIALSPLVVFVVLYFAASIWAGDFYKMPLTVAFLLSSIYAIAIFDNRPIAKRIETFSRGAGNSQMMSMIWIFILAGAFAQSAKAMGSIDATVNLALHLLPGNMILPGLFMASCFISLSIGTSVGTIVALVPIATGIAAGIDAETAMVVAIIVGGAFFGDNLSFISDTTIAATSTQRCRLSDKFRVNAFLAIPAAVVVFIVYIFLGQGMETPSALPDIEYIKVLPYVLVLVAAICGMNVMSVLILGIALTGIIGVIGGVFDVFDWCGSLSNGILGMGELIIITMMAGGMLEIIKEKGGLDFIIRHTTKRISTKRGAEFCIAGLICFVNVCTANNTVAIITVGDIAKEIADRFGVDNRKSASILDTMSCCTQGLLPYGAQVLMAAGIASVAPMAIIPYLFYPILLGIITLTAISIKYPRRYS